MKYLINTKTKQHYIQPGMMVPYGPKYDEVEADSEGWIPHTGDECPLPKDVRCDIKCANGSVSKHPNMAREWVWKISGEISDITHYRPILTEKAQEPEPVVKDSLTADLLNRLKAAHAQAQQIPDLEAELREVLAGMGYDLVRLSPFVESDEISKRVNEYHKDFNSLCSQVRDPQADPAEDMSDWRNWRVGDELKCLGAEEVFTFVAPSLITNRVCLKDSEDETFFIETQQLRFHRRPAKGE